jgi:DNA (cytosine-5)-methyltransferase 1
VTRINNIALSLRYAPYTMAGVRVIPKNGYTVISTFSGCGGSSLGYKLAGFDVRCASEFDKEAADTYEANFPGVPVLRKDIRETSGQELLDAAKLKPGELDVFDGSPPCCPFSTAGRRENGWGQIKNYSGQKQRTDDLFWEYARILGELKPRVFVAENVSGLTMGTAVGFFNEILGLLRSKGYEVDWQLLDASHLGCPQKRERLFFIGFRSDLRIRPRFPELVPDSAPTLREALQGLEAPVEDEAWEKGSAVAYLLRFLLPGMTGTEVLQDIRDKRVPMPSLEDGEFAAKWARKLPMGYFGLVRLCWDGVPGTVMASNGSRGIACSHIHPSEDRKLSIAELKRVCTFPDDFVLTGDFVERWERLGRAIPPWVMRSVARKIASVLDSSRHRR